MSNSVRVEIVVEDRDIKLDNLISEFIDAEIGFDSYEEEEIETARMRLDIMLQNAITIDRFSEKEIARLLGNRIVRGA